MPQGESFALFLCKALQSPVLSCVGPCPSGLCGVAYQSYLKDSAPITWPWVWALNSGLSQVIE